METSFDVVVVGLGAVGSAAAYHLARHGQRVLGLDRFEPPHTHGSSHGGSRIIRKAYFEGARYLPLLERAYELWYELEAAADVSLLRVTGGLNIGPPEGDLVSGARWAAKVYGVDFETLTADEVRDRFSVFRLPEGHVGLWEPEAGVLDPEACIRAHLDLSRRHAATLRTGETVTGWEPDGTGVAVTTARATYRAERLVLCAGGWLGDLMRDATLPLVVERQYNGWFRPVDGAERFGPEACPVYLWEYEAERLLYGFPDLGAGVKAGLHHHGAQAAHPDDLQRDPTEEDEAALRTHLRRLLPGADGPLVRAATCFYTNTPDRHYVVDVHPRYEQVVFASACSGHGFKVSCAVGEALAERVLEMPHHVDMGPFRCRW